MDPQECRVLRKKHCSNLLTWKAQRFNNLHDGKKSIII
jgi:hypothetical protein